MYAPKCAAILVQRKQIPNTHTLECNQKVEFIVRFKLNKKVETFHYEWTRAQYKINKCDMFGMAWPVETLENKLRKVSNG